MPTVDGIDVGGAYRPAGDGTVVGGDFYDVFEIRDGSWGIALGDVCGKGASRRHRRPRSPATRSGPWRCAPSSRATCCAGCTTPSPAATSTASAPRSYLTAEADDDGVQVCMSAGGHHLPLRVDRRGRDRGGRAGRPPARHARAAPAPRRVGDPRARRRAGPLHRRRDRGAAGHRAVRRGPPARRHRRAPRSRRAGARRCGGRGGRGLPGPAHPRRHRRRGAAGGSGPASR